MNSSCLVLVRVAVATTLIVCGIAHAAAAGIPFNLKGSYRLRYESLDNRFRQQISGSDQIIMQRLLINGRVGGEGFYGNAELEDSRAWHASNDTPLGTDDVDAAELLQAYLGYARHGLIKPGDSLDLKLGRFTMDIGSRRLVARNRFRNSLNAFTGFYAEWHSAPGYKIQAFYTWPMQRRPTAKSDLLRNGIQADTQNSAERFWGVAGSRPVSTRWQMATFVYGLAEKDTPEIATRNRRLITPGIELSTRSDSATWDYDIEAALQLGHSRTSTSLADTTDLLHRAGFIHLSASRGFAANWSPRITFQYDYASGDRDPNDQKNNRFDTLFGARRFDFGPTGIYGPFVRANISSPGVRLAIKPTARLRGLIGYRAIWLASARGQSSFGTDPGGNAGTFAGQQVEVRVRFAAVPKVLGIEAGVAWLDKGPFMKNAPLASPDGNSVYGYLQGTFNFGM